MNGNILLAEMKQDTRDKEIYRLIHSCDYEVIYPKKKFDGSEIACFVKAYPLKILGYKNDTVSHICERDVYGNAVILKVNNDGFKCLMNHQKARNIMESIKDEYLFY